MERLSEIYDSDDGSYSGRSSDIYDPEFSFESERASESTMDRTESMPPPPSLHTLLQKNAGLELEVNDLLRQIRVLKFQVEEITKQRDALKEENAKQKQETETLHSKYEVVKQRVAELTGELPNQGGTRKNKRIKHVSKYSTSSQNHDSRRHASKRQKSRALR